MPRNILIISIIDTLVRKQVGLECMTHFVVSIYIKKSLNQSTSVKSIMNAEREIARHFSWIPPPLTVMRVTEKAFRNQKSKKPNQRGRLADERIRYEDIASNETRRKFKDKNREIYNENNYREINDMSKNIDAKHENAGKQGETKQGVDEPMICEEVISVESINLAEMAPDIFDEENISEEEEEVRNSNGNEMPIGAQIRKESNSEHYQIEGKAINVDNLMRSRKKSEFNPSQKFLSFSFQNDGNEYDEISKNGAMYLKRINSDELKEGADRYGKEKGESSKSNKKVKEKKEERKYVKKEEKSGRKEEKVNDKRRKNGVVLKHNGIALEEDHLLKQEEKRNMNAKRRKSVFTHEEIGSEPVDVNDIMNRRKSTASYKEKFLSMSFEGNDGNSTPYTSKHGGLYAKRIADVK